MLEEILLLVREHATVLAHPERMMTRSVETLIRDILDAQFASEARLSFAERSKVQALIGRWINLEKELTAYLRGADDLPAQAQISRALRWFGRYVDEVKIALAETEAKPKLGAE
jgi:hypothetical protein